MQYDNQFMYIGKIKNLNLVYNILVFYKLLSMQILKIDCRTKNNFYDI